MSSRQRRLLRIAAVAALGLVAGYLCVLYVITPIAGDVLVTLGAASQARFHGGWPGGTIEAWDLRGFANKSLMYALDRIATGLGATPPTAQYEMVIKALGLVGVLLAAAGTAVVARWSFVTTRLGRLSVFFALVIAYTSVSASFTQLQAETTAAIVAVFAAAFVTRPERWAWAAAGAIASTTILFKGITVLAGVAALFGVMVFVRDRRLRRVVHVAVWWALGTVVIVGLVFLFARQEIIDIRDATTFQGTFERRSLGSSYALVQNVLHHQVGHVPIVLVGIFAWVVGVIVPRDGIRYFRREHVHDVVIATAWLGSSGFFGALALGIQGRGFAYHLATFIPFGVCAVGYAAVSLHSLPPARRVAATSLAAVVGVALLVAPSTGLALNGDSNDPTEVAAWMKLGGARRDALVELADRARACDGPVLYLDYGIGAYAIRKESVLRYVYPLPLQRQKAGLVDDPLREQLVAQAEAFHGTCVVLQYGWISEARQPWLAPVFRRLDAEYHYETFTSGDERLYIRDVGGG